MRRLRVITWNVNGRTKSVQEHVEELARHRPDVVLLQEVRDTAREALERGLRGRGLAYVQHPSGAAVRGPKGRARTLGLFTAARLPLARVSTRHAGSPWPERLLMVRLRVGRRTVDILNVGVPPGSVHKWTKIDVIEACVRLMSRRRNERLIVAGDFNTPQEECEHGGILPWGARRTDDGWIRVPKGDERWARAELELLDGRRGHGLVDAFRMANGYRLKAFSWYWKRDASYGRRFDHCFVSPTFRVREARYLHSLQQIRNKGLSDHSPLLVELGV